MKETASTFWAAQIPEHSGKVIDEQTQTSLSYSSLNQQINAFITSLPRQRQLMALIADNSLDFVIAYLALLRAQHVVLLLDKEDSDERHQAILTQYKVNGLIHARQISWRSKEAINLHPTLALLLTTSGSTGSSKMVKLSYDNLTANCQAICQYLPISANDTVMTTLPLHYSFGLSLLHSHLSVGATIILSNANPLEKRFWQVFNNFSITAFYGVPFSFSLLNKLNLKRLPLTTIKYFACAGGKIAVTDCQLLTQFCEQHKQDLYLMYGQTEATARMAFLPPSKASTKPTFIGQAIPNGELFLLDKHNNKIIQANQAGELCYQGANVFIGYANSSEELAKADSPKWLTTGDIAEFDHEGDFKIIGRVKRIIKVVGKRINLDEVEQHLTLFYQQTIVVTGIDDKLTIHLATDSNIQAQNSNNALLSEESKLGEEVLTQALKFTCLHSRYITINYLSAFPLLSNGKIDYKALNG